MLSCSIIYISCRGSRSKYFICQCSIPIIDPIRFTLFTVITKNGEIFTHTKTIRNVWIWLASYSVIPICIPCNLIPFIYLPCTAEKERMIKICSQTLLVLELISEKEPHSIVQITISSSSVPVYSICTIPKWIWQQKQSINTPEFIFSIYLNCRMVTYKKKGKRKDFYHLELIHVKRYNAVLRGT